MAIENHHVPAETIRAGNLIIHGGKLYEVTKAKRAQELHGFQVTVEGRESPFVFSSDELVMLVTL